MKIERPERNASQPPRRRVNWLAPALGSCLVILVPQTASAYIDPGAGSFVVQAVIAMIAGIAVAGRLYWSKLKGLLGIASSEVEDEDDLLDDDD